jgi:hypothetical protein
LGAKFTICLSAQELDKVQLQMRRNGGNRNAAIRELIVAGSALLAETATPESMAKTRRDIIGHIAMTASQNGAR